MGFYINETEHGFVGTTFDQKCRSLENSNALAIPEPTEFQEGLVCVVDNGMFAAAGYAYNESEMKVFKEPDGRRKRWYYWKEAKNYAK